MKTLEDAIQHYKADYEQLKLWLIELKNYRDSKVFKLDKEETEAAYEFYKVHKECCNPSTIGGNFSYIITPIGLGNCVTIRCNACGEEEDITNVENW